MSRFRIPPEHRETVTIVRKDAMDPHGEEVVAEGVVCMIQPVVSGTVQRDAVDVRTPTGIAIQETDRMALLSKPNMDVIKGDFLEREDGERFRVIDVLRIKGSPVMRLYVRSQGIL